MSDPTNSGDAVPTVLVLDGGFSTQLSCHVGTNVDGDPLWSARFLQTHPEQVVNTHLDFLRAGADIIMTNTYQASIGGFVKYLNVTPEKGYAIISRAVDLAKRARDLFLKECESNPPDRTPLIAGSVGPYGAHLHDGSEYDGSYADTTSAETMREWHKPRLQALVDGGVDLLAFETIPCQKEGEVLVEMLKEYPNMKAWLSLSCKDDQTIAHGEDYQTVTRKCYDMNPEQIIAVVVNCCSPNIVKNLLKSVNEGWDKVVPLVVYPNSGEKYNPQIGWIDRDKCEALENFVHNWLDIGVRYIGGCCRTYGTDITHIRTEVQSWCDAKRFGGKRSVLNI